MTYRESELLLILINLSFPLHEFLRRAIFPGILALLSNECLVRDEHDGVSLSPYSTDGLSSLISLGISPPPMPPPKWKREELLRSFMGGVI